MYKLSEETFVDTYEGRINEITKIISDANNFQVIHTYQVKFKSKGKDKREKYCIAFFDNRGIKSIIKQVDCFKQFTYQINGQPGNNSKLIFERN